MAKNKVEVEVRIDGTQAQSEAAQLQGAFDSLKESGSDLAKSIGQRLEQSLNKVSPVLGRFYSGMRNVITAVKAGSDALPAATSGAQRFGNALARLTLIPIVALLTAVVAALTALTSWLTRTEEGQNKVAVATAACSQVLEVLLNMASRVGQALYNAFTKPQTALRELKNLIQGVKQDAAGMGQSIQQRMNIQRRQNQLDADERTALVERERLQTRINQLREKAADLSVKASERQKAVGEAQKLTNQLYDQEVGLARRRYEIVRDTNALGDSNKDDLRAEAEAEAALVRLEGERAQAQRALTREQQRVSRQGTAGDSQAAQARAAALKAQAEAVRQQRAFSEELLALQRDAADAEADARVSAIADSGARERAQRSEQHKRLLAQVEREEADVYKAIYEQRRKAWDAAHKDTPYETTDAGQKGYGAAAMQGTLTADEQQYYEARMAAKRAAWQKEEAEYSRWLEEQSRREAEQQREAISQWVQQYGDYQQRRQDIITTGNDALCRLEEEMQNAVTDEQRAALQARTDSQRAQTQEQLALLDEQYGKQARLLDDLLGDAAKRSTKELDAVVEKYSELLTFLEQGGGGDRRKLFDLGFTDTDLNRLLQQLNSGKLTLEGIRDALKGIQKTTESRSLFGEMKQGFQQAWGMGEGNQISPTQIISLVNDNAQSLVTLTEKLGLAETDFGRSVKGFADGVGGFNSAIESLLKGDLIGVVNGLLDGIAGFGRLGITALTGSGNEDRMEAEVSRLTTANKRLAAAIDDLADVVGDSTSTNQESIEAYREQLKAEQEWRQNQLAAINARASEWTNTGYGFLGLGGKSSFNALMKGNDWLGWRTLTETLRRHGYDTQVNRNNVLQLTPEQMHILELYAPKEWAQIMNGGGHKKPTDLINEYIEHAGAEDALTDALNKKLTGYTWEGFLDSYKQLLADLDSTTEDFAEHIEKIITQALVDAFINSEAIQGEIRDLYDRIAWYSNPASEGGTDLTEGEIADLMESNQRIQDKLLAWRKAAQQAGIIPMGSSDNDTNDTFSSLRDAWIDTLASMQGDAEDWSRQIAQIMARELISTSLLDAGFQQWLDDWKERYRQVIDDEDNHRITEGERDSRLQALIDEQVKKREELAESAQAMLQALGLEEQSDSIKTAFDSLHSDFLSTLTDMNTDAREWSRKITQTMVEQLIESQLLNASFDEQMDDWRQRFADTMNDTTLSDAEREARLARLREELEQLREHLSEEAQRFLDSLGYADLMKEERATPFDSWRDSYRQMLQDMTLDTADFVSRVSQLMADDFIDAFVLGDAFDERLEEWKKRYRDILQDGSLSEAERLQQLRALSELIGQEREQMQEETKQILDLLGLGGSAHEDQQATQTMASQATYDQFELFLGMQTSSLMVQEQQRALQQQILDTLRLMGGTATPADDYGEQISSRLRTANEYLLAVKKTTEAMRSECAARLDTIASHLSKL